MQLPAKEEHCLIALLMQQLRAELLPDHEKLFDSFDGRLLFQKAVFLLKHSGWSIPFGFSWYVHGPYSPSLAKAVYQEVLPNPRLDNVDAELALAAPLAENLRSFCRRVVAGLPSGMQMPQWLELLGSLAYLSAHGGDTLGRLEAKKGWFTRAQMEKAQRVLAQIGEARLSS